jgi:hypothetical protein
VIIIIIMQNIIGKLIFVYSDKIEQHDYIVLRKQSDFFQAVLCSDLKMIVLLCFTIFISSLVFGFEIPFFMENEAFLDHFSFRGENALLTTVCVLWMN